MKKKLFFKFFVFAVIGALFTMTSCKDYDDDISGLQTQVTSVKGDLSALQSSVSGAQADAAAAKTAASDALVKAQEALEAAQAAGGSVDLSGLEKDIADLQGEIEEINKQLATLAKLEGKITALAAEIEAANEAQLEAIKEDIAVITQELKELVLPVTGFVFIPDFTSLDGTPQLPVTALGEWYKPDTEEENWDPYFNDDEDDLLTYYKGITYAKYHVNPSNATLKDIEVVGVLHKTSEILNNFMSSTNDEPLLKAVVEDVTLENGILTVPILINKDLYDIFYEYIYGPSNGDHAASVPMDFRASRDYDDELFYNGTFNWWENISVAVQVKVKDDKNKERLLTTEYVRTQLSLLFSRIELVREGDRVGRWPNVLPSHKADNIVSDYYYKESASIPLWNGYNRNTMVYDNNYSINLNDSLRAIAKFGSSWRILEEFGYDNIEDYFVYELIDVDNEGVNQSSYVTLNDGILKVKPASDGSANQSAVGRTPVVLAKVVVDGKVYAAGYLKVVITEEVDNSPVEFEFTLEDYLLGCNSEYSLTDVDINEIDFDQIFNHPRIKLGKDAFFAAYRANYDRQIRTRVIEDPAGADGDEIDFHWNIEEPTQGGQLNNYIEAIIENDAPAGKYIIETTLRGRANQPDVVITWTVNVVLPEGISLITNSIYYKNGGIIVNPTIYEQGALSSTAYEALLNNTFVHESGNFGYEGLTQTCQDYLTPYFVFTEVPAGFTISTDKKSIWKGDLKAAEIVQVEDEFFVRLNNIGSNPPSGPWGNNTPFSDAAKQLVGKTVKIQPRAYINSQPLNDISLYDPFTVMFRKPLTLQFPDNAVVYDQANDGVKNVYTLNLYSPTVIKDWNGKLISVLNNEGRSLIEHYEIDFTMEWHPGNYWSPSTWELGSPFKLGKPQVNLQVDGTIGGAYRDIPMGTGMKIDIDYEEGEIYTHPAYGSMNTPATITFEWSNSSTGEVQNEFMVRIPVSVKHKWSPIAEPLMDYLYITVKPGNGN